MRVNRAISTKIDKHNKAGHAKNKRVSLGLQEFAVLREYETAVRTGNMLLATKIRRANPDLETNFQTTLKTEVI